MRFLSGTRRTVVICILLALLAFAATRVGIMKVRAASYVPPETLAQCFTDPNDSAAISGCLNKTTDSLLSEMSTRSLMSYIIASSSPDTVVGNCHTIAHVIGEETFKRSTSLEQALSACSPACNSGCTHGALGAGVLSELGEGYAGDDIAHSDTGTIEKIGTRYCAQSNPLCHGIGHLLFILNKNYTTTLKTCDKIASGFALESCYEGVFMESAGDKDSLFLAPMQKPQGTDGYEYPCNGVATPYQHACLQFLPKFEKSLFDAQGIATSSRIDITIQTCQLFSGNARDYCFEGVGVQPAAYRHTSFCDGMPTENDRISCTLGSVTVEVNNDRWPQVMAICGSITETKRKDVCYDTVFEIMQAYLQKDPGASIPDICKFAGSDECLEAYGKFLKVQSTLPDYRFGYNISP